jgi:galactokinase
VSDRSFRAPGRVNLIGDHTDYNEGFVLPMAIDREVVAAARPTDDGRVRVRSEEHEGVVDVAADGSEEPAGVRPAWGRLIAGVVSAAAVRGRAPVGIEGRLSSAVPEGSGLSSSAAVEVAVALALADAARFAISAREVALLCQAAEHAATGVPTGVMDQLTSLCGVEGAALLIDCRSFELEPVPLPAGLAVLAVNSGIPRRLEGTPYAERRSACDAAAWRLGLASLRDATLEQVLDDPVARHVVTENERVHATAAALRRGDLERAGRLFAESHASLRDDFRVSTPELDVLVEELEGAGAYGARLTGAGFGGSVVAICADERAEAVAAATVAYARRTGRTATAMRCRAVAGAVAQLPSSSARSPQA